MSTVNKTFKKGQRVVFIEDRSKYDISKGDYATILSVDDDMCLVKTDKKNVFSDNSCYILSSSIKVIEKRPYIKWSKGEIEGLIEWAEFCSLDVVADMLHKPLVSVAKKYYDLVKAGKIC